MKRLFLTLAFTFTLCFCIASCTSEEQTVTDEILLSQDWKIQSSSKIDQDGKALSSSNASVEGWYNATVPSTVMGTLTQNGLYKDLLVSKNYKDADKSPFDVSWWYRTSFKLSPVEKGKHVKIEFDGLTYRANIWLNGQLIAPKEEVYGPFCRFSFDITDKVKEDNILAVEIFRAQKGEPNIGFVDWNPRPLDESMGIFREVRVITTGDVDMKNTWIKTKVNTESLKEAWLTVETQVQNLSDQAVKGELTGKIENISFSVPVSLEAKEKKTITITPDEAKGLHIQNPRLWWSHDMGTPEMYNLDLRFVTNKQVSASQKVDFGIRQIETYMTEQGHKGFVLNGKKVLIKSAGWTDDIFLRDTPVSNEIQTKYVKDMNMNSIRFENIWGNSQSIYNLCDRYGLLAIVGWSCQWEWEGYLGIPDDDFGCIRSEHDMKLMTRFLYDQVTWLRNHPSVIAWMMGSDKLPRPELEKMYMEIYPKIDDRPYLGAAKALVSEITGATGMKMYGPYEYVGPNYWFIDSKLGGAYGFNTETGPGAQVPVLESIEKMIPKNKLWPLNNEWDYHCTTATEALNNLDVLNKTIDGKFGKPANLKEYLDRAHLLSYESTKSMFEAFRVNKTEATGIVQWMLNSAWPSLYWQLYDFYMIPTSAYYGVRTANMPQQLIYNYKDNGIYAVNETMDGKEAKAVVKIYSFDSKLLSEKDIQVSMKADNVQKIHEIGAPENSFVFLSLYDNQNNLLAENFYCLSAKLDEYDWEKSNWVGSPLTQYTDFRGLNNLPKTDLKVSVLQSAGEKENVISLEIENTSSTIAFFSQYLLKDANGEIVYPVFWEDNYINILPGQKKVLRCSFDSKLINSKVSTLQVTGWNTEPQTIKVN